MERPEHTLGGNAHQDGKSRFSGVIIVALVHVGIGALLILGMNADKIEKKIQDLQATVEKQKVPPKVPPPPPPKVEKPPPPFVPPPDVNIQTEAPPPRVVNTPVPPPPPPPPRPAPPPPAPPAAPPSPPEIIAATHTKPPYPPISQRLGEHGTTLMNVTVDESGKCADATVATSSGSARLDQAAIDYCKQRYKWKPATRDGKPVTTKIQLQVVWSLDDAQ